jgi:hypothetical protein
MHLHFGKVGLSCLKTLAFLISQVLPFLLENLSIPEQPGISIDAEAGAELPISEKRYSNIQ